ncbi:MAG TPA: hypothetical protein VF021_12545 [Longimicrobiales bacterium]
MAAMRTPTILSILTLAAAPLMAEAPAYLVVDALIKANKDFDLLILPNQRHGYGEQFHDAPALGLLRSLPDGGVVAGEL